MRRLAGERTVFYRDLYLHPAVSGLPEYVFAVADDSARFLGEVYALGSVYQNRAFLASAGLTIVPVTYRGDDVAAVVVADLDHFSRRI